MNKSILVTAAILGMSSVILGAFAAHGLKATLPLSSMDTFETGVRYQMYHAIILLFVGSTSVIQPKSKQIVFYLMLIGIILFSGSIYGLATDSLTEFDFKSIGFLTPIGGLFLIIGWAVILLSFLKLKIDKSQN